MKSDLFRTLKIYFALPVIFFMILMTFSTRAFAQTASASSSKDSVTAGEIFRIYITSQLNQTYSRVIYPDSSDFPPVIDFYEAQQYRITDFADSVTYRLQFFGNGDITLPPFEIALVNGRDTTYIYTNPVSVAFKTVLPSEDAELKPMKPIFFFSDFPWALALILLAVLAAAWFTYKTLTKKPAESISQEVVFTPYLSPLKELENTLIYLRKEYDLAQTQDYKFFYSSLSDSVRKYFEDLYNIPALESTSRELLRYLDAFGVDVDMIKSTRTILNKSDMVKFAKYTPTLDSAWACYQETIDFKDRAELVDASRIARKRNEYEQQFRRPEPDVTADNSEQEEKEENQSAEAQ